MSVEEEKQQAFQNLCDFADILAHFEVPYVLDGGTLLGAHRDQDFCDGDHNDIDLTTGADDAHKIPEILHRVQVLGFSIVHDFRREEDRHRSAQIAIKRNGMKIDLMFKEILGDWSWWTVYLPANRGVIYKAVPRKFYDDVCFLGFKGRTFPVPFALERFLEFRYGDWRTPIHRKRYSCYRSDRTIVTRGYEEIAAWTPSSSTTQG
jgi:phosphorylcholine metabolism protein LicD